MARVTDSMVTHWLIWARNHGEIVAYSTGKGPYNYAKKGQTRRFRVKVTPGITANGAPFHAKEGLLDLMGHSAEDVVPHEMMLTAREALLFGMGCAVGRAAAHASPENNWQREGWASWSKDDIETFVARREDAREEIKLEYEREREEWEADRQRRMAAYRARKEAEERGTEIEQAEVPQLEQGDGNDAG